MDRSTGAGAKLIRSCLLTTLLLLFALASFTRAEQAANSPPLGDLDPSFSDPLGVDPAGGRGAWKEFKDENEHDSQYGRVVRTVETYWHRPSAASPNQPLQSGSASSASPNNIVQVEEEAHILTTLGRLRALVPIFSWIFHHPLRALTQYLFPFLFHALRASIRNAFKFTWYGLRKGYALAVLFSSPFLAGIAFVCSPFIWLYGVFVSLSPIWFTLLGAILLGAILGGIAGASTGTSAQSMLDELAGSIFGKTVGVSEDTKLGGVAAKLKAKGGGASFERVSKGKERMMDADDYPSQSTSFLSTSYPRRPYSNEVDYSATSSTEDESASKASSKTRTSGTTGSSESMFGPDGRLRESLHRVS